MLEIQGDCKVCDLVVGRTDSSDHTQTKIFKIAKWLWLEQWGSIIQVRRNGRTMSNVWSFSFKLIYLKKQDTLRPC